MATGRAPVTSVVKPTAPNVGAPAALPCKSVVVVPSEPSGAGAVPAPPPNTNALAVSAADVLSALEELKYGMPPLVPVVLNVIEPLEVTGEPDTPKMPPGPVRPTLVTVPPPAGAAQAPSPRMNVELEHVPDHKLITSLEAAAVNALVPLPLAMPVSVPAPIPPCATVTNAFVVSAVVLAFGNVIVLILVVGPVKFRNALPSTAVDICVTVACSVCVSAWL